MIPKESQKPLKASVYIAVFAMSLVGAFLAVELPEKDLLKSLMICTVANVLLFVFWSPHPYRENDEESES